MKPLDLLDIAEALIKGSARPKDANLRRSHSSVYYAMFHILAKDSADLFLGGNGASRGERAWQQTYRALNHGSAKTACGKVRNNGFPVAIENFADHFCTMQEKRHNADYDPLARFVKSDVSSDIGMVRQAIRDYLACDIKDRRAFCAWVLFSSRK